jgi:hypothetical protein
LSSELPLFLDQDQVEDFASVFSAATLGELAQPLNQRKLISLPAPISNAPLDAQARRRGRQSQADPSALEAGGTRGAHQEAEADRREGEDRAAAPSRLRTSAMSLPEIAARRLDWRFSPGPGAGLKPEAPRKPSAELSSRSTLNTKQYDLMTHDTSHQVDGALAIRGSLPHLASVKE